MAKENTNKPAEIEVPPMPASPLLPPVPQMLRTKTEPSDSMQKREIVDAFRPVSRHEREFRQMAKQAREDAAAFLVQAQNLEARLGSILKRGSDPQAAESFAKEGLTIDATERLSAALERLLNEFMPPTNH